MSIWIGSPGALLSYTTLRKNEPGFVELSLYKLPAIRREDERELESSPVAHAVERASAGGDDRHVQDVHDDPVELHNRLRREVQVLAVVSVGGVTRDLLDLGDITRVSVVREPFDRELGRITGRSDSSVSSKPSVHWSRTSTAGAVEPSEYSL